MTEYENNKIIEIQLQYIFLFRSLARLLVII
jgi:hypothetical protein